MEAAKWVERITKSDVGLSGLLMVARLDSSAPSVRPGHPGLSLSDAHDQTLAVLSILRLLLVAASPSVAFWLHPAQARRSGPESPSTRSRPSGSVLAAPSHAWIVC